MRLFRGARVTFPVDELGHVPELFGHFRPHPTQLREGFGIGRRQVTQATSRARELRLAHPLSVGMPSHTPIMQRIPLLDQTLRADFLSLSADRGRCPSSVATSRISGSANEPALLNQAAIALEQRKRFRGPTETLLPVTVCDISMSGAFLALPNDMQPDIGQVLDLVIDGQRGAVRVRRTAPADSHLVGVEFIDPHPAFLQTIYQWLGRDEVGVAEMR